MIRKVKYLLISFTLLHNSLAQNLSENTSYRIKRATGQLVLDGKPDEKDWISAEKGGGFFQTFPTDNQPAKDSTVFMITYDNQFIYVAVICYDYIPGSPITTSLRRDFSWLRNDNISFYIDPYNDRSNGFTFQVTPDNVQREGLVILGGDVQDDWDNKWYSAVAHGENFWSVEMGIPFKSIRYNSGSEWNFQFIRNNQKRNERSTWISVPQQFRASDLAFTGKMIWDQKPPEAGANVSFIPYATASGRKNFEYNEPSEIEGNAGFDAKIGVTNSLNLDLTLNPDFSQVEVDQQVTNLQRFEIAFPERRQFFLENQDLFAQNGFRVTRPFFSRRIGIQGSGDTQRGVPIVGGARLSGKIGSNWRLGVLNMVTNEDATNEEISPAQNYSVAVLERQLFERSRVSAVFVGRTNLGQVALDSFYVAENGGVRNQIDEEIDPRDTLYTLSAYNYVYGLDYNLATIDNRWEGNFYYHRSLDPDRPSDAFSHGQFLRYRTTKINARIFSRTVGENYHAEVGFVPRAGYTDVGGALDLNFFSSGKVQRQTPSVQGKFLMNRQGRLLDWDYSANYNINFLNSSSLEFEVGMQSVELTSLFDPSGSGGLELMEGDNFTWTRYSIFYGSDQRRNFSYAVFTENGEFYNGERLNMGTEIVFRLPPTVQLQLNFEYNKVTLPKPYNDSELILLGPRVDLTLTNKVFFTTFVQYNTQAENFGHNSRFQWRFKPVSDLFVVYTDNYLTNPNFSTRDRALVIKLSYWLNL